MSLTPLLANTVLTAQIAIVLRIVTTALLLFVLARQIEQFGVSRLYGLKIALMAIVLVALFFSIPSWAITLDKAYGNPLSVRVSNMAVLTSAVSGLLVAVAFWFMYKKTKE